MRQTRWAVGPWRHNNAAGPVLAELVNQLVAFVMNRPLGCVALTTS